MRSTSFFIALLVYSTAFSQGRPDIIKERGKFPEVNNLATIKGYPFNKELHISKDSLGKGLKIVLSDPSYRIDSFALAWYGEDSDIYTQKIKGDSITFANVPVLKKVKTNDYFELYYFLLEKGGKQFSVTRSIVIWWY